VATSYLHLTSVSAGAAAENAADKKRPTRVLPPHTPFLIHLWHLNLRDQLTKMAYLSCTNWVADYLSSQVNSMKPPSYSKECPP